MKAITFEHKSSVPWLSKVYGICGIYNCPQLQIPYTLGSHCTYKCALNIRISEKEICQLHVNVLNSMDEPLHSAGAVLHSVCIYAAL